MQITPYKVAQITTSSTCIHCIGLNCRHYTEIILIDGRIYRGKVGSTYLNALAREVDYRRFRVISENSEESAHFYIQHALKQSIMTHFLEKSWKSSRTASDVLERLFIGVEKNRF